MTSEPAERHTPTERQELADRLKERIYVTFTALAVLLLLRSHGEIGAVEALGTLVVAVLATLLAVFIADVLAHTTVHQRLPSTAEVRHVLSVTGGAFGAIALPVILLALSALGFFPADAALRGSAFALVAALVFFGYLAVRRAHLPWWQRLVALTAEAALGLTVIGLEPAWGRGR